MAGGEWQADKSAAIMEVIVDRLCAAREAVSGEELSREAGAGRNAIWKRIERLRSMGYVIEGTPHAGYRMVHRPDTPYPWEIARGLNTRQLGRHAVYLVSVTSTNDRLKQMARSGAPHGLVVAADTQTAGRGRRGRAWVTPPGAGLCFSVLLRPLLPPSGLALFPLLTGVAVAKAIQAVAGLPAELKWPNDVLIGARKACGILLEMSAEAEVVHHVVLGIGVNVNGGVADFPAALQASVTTIEQETGKQHNRVALLQQILIELEQRYHSLLDTGAAAILDEARQLSATLGKQVDILGVDGTLFSGRAVSIAPDGALLVVDSAGRERRFYAGDVSVRARD